MQRPTWKRRLVRGMIGAMAMTGMRQVSTGLGLLKESPPETLVERTPARLINRLPPERRKAVIELLHWSYGAVGGVAFSLIPGPLRRPPWAGPAYGAITWGAFEALIAPALGQTPEKRPASDQVVLLIDHVLYGVVVGGLRRER